MTIDEIKELVRLVNDSGIGELELQRGENRVRIRRNVVTMNPEIVVPAATLATPVSLAAPAISLPAASTANPSELATATPDSATEKQDEDLTTVKSPIVGTFYDAPSPAAPPFVKVGDQVEARQVLCIIESMKLMNEIEAEASGTVVAKLIDNGRPVEYGEALFTIRPR